MAYLGLKITIYQAWKAQIALLITKKVDIPAEYSDYIDIFSEELAAKLARRSDINEHSIDLELGKQPPYKSIYSLMSIEFKTFKTYIETNLANSFIRLFKSSTNILILFV